MKTDNVFLMEQYKFLDKVKEILKEDSKQLEAYSENHFANSVEFQLCFVSLANINKLCDLLKTNDVVVASRFNTDSYGDDYSMIELEFNNVEFNDKQKDTSFKGEF
jgi:hypothetical protein